MALPGRLGGALANATRHVRIAMSGLRLSNGGLVKVGGISATKQSHAVLRKHSTPAIARSSGLPVGPPSNDLTDRVGNDRNNAWHHQQRPPVGQDHASAFQRQQTIVGDRAVQKPVGRGSSPAIAPAHITSATTAAGRKAIEFGPERPRVAGNIADGGGALADARGSEGRGTTRVSNGRKAQFATVPKNVEAEQGAPAGQAARLKLTIGQRRPAAPGSAGHGRAETAGPILPTFVSMPSSQILGTNPKPRSLALVRSGSAAAPYAPVRRAEPRSSDDVSFPATSSELSRNLPANPTSRGAATASRAGTAKNVAVAQKDENAAAAAAGGATQGDVFLDGTLVGRWMARKMAQEAGRPPSGSSAFDPTRSPFPPGRMIGG